MGRCGEAGQQVRVRGREDGEVWGSWVAGQQARGRGAGRCGEAWRQVEVRGGGRGGEARRQVEVRGGGAGRGQLGHAP